MTGKLTLAVVLAVSVAGCHKSVEQEKPPAQVQVTAVTQATVRRIVQGDGVLFPFEQASVTSKISATVQKFYVNRGDRVKRGQLLAVLENRDLVSAAAESKGLVAQAESNLRTTEASTVPDAIVKAQTDLDAARVTLESARKVFESRQQLLKQGALAGRLVDESQLAYTQAESQFRVAQEHLRVLQAVRKDQIQGVAAQVESAKAHLQAQEAQVSYTHIVSPISGVIADRPLNTGEMASSGAPLLTVVDISKLVARVNVPQTEASALKTGQVATLSQAGVKEEMEGRVSVVSPASDPNTTTIQIWILIDNADGHLKPGATVHAAIATEVFKAATVLPAAAVLPGEEGGVSVLTVSSDSLVHRRKIAPGVREGNQVQVLSGVNPGEEVVITGGLGLDDNVKVQVVTTAVEESSEDEETPGAAAPSAAKPKPQ